MEMVEFRFLASKNNETHVHADIELVYILEGVGSFLLEEKRYQLKKEDFVVINPNQRHSLFSRNEDFLAASLQFSYVSLSRMLKRDMIFFVCNSAMEENEIIDEVRGLLRRIVSAQYHSKGSDVIYMNSLYYELLHILTMDFLLDKDDKRYHSEEHKFDDRKAQITEYVMQNYDKDISLKDLADRLFLSNAYLSKYIKRQFGMNFIDYVNSVRLNYAVSQLLYSDKQLVRIAMDTGFASSAALNKVFKEKYNMTPTEYRLQWKDKEIKKQTSMEEAEEVEKRVTRYFSGETPGTARKSRQNEEHAVLSRVEPVPLEKIWSQMINVGTAADLLHSDMQEHVVYLKNKLHIRYVRFWDLYSNDIFMGHSTGGNLNFDRIDRILDFLMKNDLRPYMELRIKPKVLVQNNTGRLLRPEDVSEPSEEHRIEFMRRFIIHLINRYTSVEVEKWYFEVWKLEQEQYQDGQVVGDMVEPASRYLEIFDNIAGTLRMYLPGIQIGGGGFALRWGEDYFRELLEQWKERENLPDFLTVYCYPYTADSIAMNKSQTLDAEFMKKNLTRFHELIREAQFPVDRLHVTEWSFSVSSRNVLNDHCMKGAYMVKNIIDSIGLTELMGYWVGSDLFTDYYDAKWILNGGGGLISKDGIRKPAYYALDFMNSLGKYLLKTGNHYIISDNGKGNYRIVCHNLKSLGYQYGLLQEDKHIVKEVDNLFTDTKKLKLHFELPAKTGGKYMLRIYTINQKYGSILDEWMEMSGDEELTPEDINYLERITTPRLLHVNCEENNNKVLFDTVLEANEIQYIHMTLKYI